MLSQRSARNRGRNRDRMNKRSSRAEGHAVAVASAPLLETQTEESQFDELMYWHLSAAAVFVLSAIVMFSVYLGLDADALQGTLYSTTLVVSNTTQPLQVKRLQDYDLFWLNVAIPCVTALFHCIQALLLYMRNGVYIGMILRKRNLVRWLEYSVSASTMSWVLVQLFGATDVYLVFTLALTVNIAMQFQGYLFEIIRGENEWVPMVAGFVSFAGFWMVSACYFYRTIAASEDSDVEVPFFVRLLFYGILGSFLVFPAIQLIERYTTWIPNWKEYEIYFVGASGVSKLFLEWTIFFAVVTR